ncbi:FAD-dependent monooxygenase [Sinorhizobium sp. BJ1]|uniref:NAD(P)-binding domain-containing protein n=1 Tax=Sinorhizobium sp. BJ1 TaxID=2035455 RepID=UPI001FE1AAF9|nr:FAD-dependent monooxygenase [Sinorhizobium sp. BJ1]
MDATVVIVGAGPAGLAVGACLKQTRINFIILEKAHEIAPARGRHYRRRHLHTVKAFSSLPYVPFPRGYPRYVPREKVVAYLEAYADGSSFDRASVRRSTQSTATRAATWSRPKRTRFPRVMSSSPPATMPNP